MSSYPRLAALTQGFTLGRPRSFVVGDGRVLFLRSRGGEDPVTCLWVLDDDGERLVCDPLLLDGADDELPPEERARRERARERAGGITAYAADRSLTVAAFALAGRLGLAHVDGAATMLPAGGAVSDPRPSPDGTRLGYVTGGHLVVTDLAGRVRTEVRGPVGTTCGLADFIASEELGRFRGWWWSPDSTRVLAAVVDESPVQVWHIADPAHPERPAAEQRYPAAGTANARVTLVLADVDGHVEPVTGWDTDAFPYLVSVSWTNDGPALLQVSARDQRRMQILALDGPVATLVREDRSDTFLDVVAGVPMWLPDGRLLHTDETGTVRRLAVDGTPVTPDDVHVAAVRGIDPDGDVAFIGTTADDPTSRHVYAWEGSDTPRLTDEAGVYDIVTGGDTQVGFAASMEHAGVATEVWRRGETTSVWSHAATPPFVPAVRFVADGDVHVAIVLPTGHVAGTKLPVLLDPYGGPHHSENLRARGGWLEPQWLADQGFAVVVADGPGTPGRNLLWEKEIRGDLATPALTGQVEALRVAAAAQPDLDLSRVGIRGWSFGGYLAALAVLRRPDVFHAAVAGAPVTEWRLYDTAYTERYLGTDPDGADAAAYDRSSLLPLAAGLERPLLLIHGLADDNVVAAHTLRLSAALLAHGKPHDVLPLTGATHMGGGASERENLLLLQVAWLRQHLG
ncbi:MAG TPA: prolyl oligopeptidase family serine peptidase [Mycobacteriales bacterium]